MVRSHSRRFARAVLVRSLVVFSLYAAVVLSLTWPLARDATTHLSRATAAAEFDSLYSAWVLWHETRALTTAPRRFADGNIYHPARDTVFHGPAALGALPYFAPAYLLSGNPALAINFVLLGCIALTATGLHLVAFGWTGTHAAGAIAGATFLTCRWVLWGFVAVTPHLAALVYFPWIVALAATPLDTARRWTALLGLVVLQCLTDLVYVAVAVLAPLAALAAARLVRPAWRPAGWRLVGLLAVTAVALLPALAAHAVVRSRIGDGAHSAWRGVERALELTHLFWKDVKEVGQPTTVAPAALVLVVLGGATALLRRSPNRRDAADDARVVAAGEPPPRFAWQHALLWTSAGTLISLTPTVTWLGHSLPMPHALLQEWSPLYEVVRRPSRLGVAGLIGLCLLAALGYAELAARLRARIGRPGLARHAAAVLATAAIAALYLVPSRGDRPLPGSYPIFAVPRMPASFAERLRTGSGPVLHLPALRAARRPMPRWHARPMYLSTLHGRPLLNGYSSYWPSGFIGRMQLAERLPDALALRELVRETSVALVWVDLEQMRPHKRRKWNDPEELAHRAGLRLVGREGGQLLFAVEQPQRDRARVPADGAVE